MKTKQERYVITSNLRGPEHARWLARQAAPWIVAILDAAEQPSRAATETDSHTAEDENSGDPR